MGLKRFLKPSILLRRKALRAGVFGGDRKWLSVFVTMFVWRKMKALFGFGDPQPVYIEDVEPGQRVVVAQDDNNKSRRQRRKADKKAAKKAAKRDAKVAKKAAKKAANRAATRTSEKAATI